MEFGLFPVPGVYKKAIWSFNKNKLSVYQKKRCSYWQQSKRKKDKIIKKRMWGGMGWAVALDALSDAYLRCPAGDCMLWPGLLNALYLPYKSKPQKIIFLLSITLNLISFSNL